MEVFEKSSGDCPDRRSPTPPVRTSQRAVGRDAEVTSTAARGRGTGGLTASTRPSYAESLTDPMRIIGPDLS